MKKIKISIALGIGCLLISCDRFLEVKEPIDRLTTEVVFSDPSSIENAVLGMYRRINFGTIYPLCGNISVLPGLSSDELQRTSVHIFFSAFENNQIPIDNQYNTNNWTYLYNAIFHANSILENIEDSTVLSKELQEQYIGEAKFIRALCHFYLVNYFGNIPLTLSTDYRINSGLSRTDVQEVYDQIMDDLNQSRELLVNKGYTADGRLRASYWAATALLARAKLYTNKYEEALALSSEVIDHGGFHIEDVENAFLATSSEAILQFEVANRNTAEGIFFVPASTATASPQFVITTELLNAFDESDKRKSMWIGEKVIGDVTFFYPYKYKIGNTITPSIVEYSIVLRLAEQYLIRAECYAHLNNMSHAIQDIDVIRERAGLPLLSDTASDISPAAFFDILLNERRLEYFAEWGHRWFDLKRLSIIDEVLGQSKANWSLNAKLYPIPEQVLLSSLNLSQNPGY